jgi:hypothetical protein
VTALLATKGEFPVKTTLAALAALGLAGCNAQGQIDPSAQAAVTATYDSVCVDSPSQPSVISAIRAYIAASGTALNAQQTNVWNAVQSMCQAGVPTTPAAAAVDALITAAAIQRAFPGMKVRM